MARAFDLRLDLRDVTPQVWRVLRVPATLTLDDLHHALQTVFGWDDFHPHVFEVGDREYGPRDYEDDEADDASEPREPEAWAGDDSELTIAQALAESPSGVTYIYDFAEEWRVSIRRENDADAAVGSEVTCLAGAETGPQQERSGFSTFSVNEANARLARARRPRATIDQPAGPRASADQQLLAHLTLVVLFLGSRPTRHGAREAWKQVRSEMLDRLQEAGLVEHDAQRRAVTLTDAGVAHAERLLQKLRSL
jgi:hypothetical protein